MSINSNKDIELQNNNLAIIKSWQDFLDLPLTLTVELGRSKMSLKAILSLEKDSIVQLRRIAGTALDILAGNQSIARGEVVTLEDTIGIRINEIIDQK